MAVRASGKKVPNKQVDGVVPEPGAAHLVRVRRRPAIDGRTGKHGIRSAHRAGLSGKNELRVAQAERQAEGLMAGGVEGRLRGWLEPCVMLQRYWNAFSDSPPPKEVGALLERVFSGEGLYLYVC
jgi:hypothetical protein